MGLDYGSRTVGVALSDALLITSQPREIIRRDRENMLRKTFARIEELILTEDVRLIVLGKPLNMDGTGGERVLRTEEFRDRLQRRTGLPVVMWDERLTTVEADEKMDRMGIPRRDRKQYVDMLAAGVILQDYMEEHRDVLQAMREGQETDNV